MKNSSLILFLFLLTGCAQWRLDLIDANGKPKDRWGSVLIYKFKSLLQY